MVFLGLPPVLESAPSSTSARESAEDLRPPESLRLVQHQGDDAGSSVFDATALQCLGNQEPCVCISDQQC